MGHTLTRGLGSKLLLQGPEDRARTSDGLARLSTSAKHLDSARGGVV
jgi:hypothetical protein